MANKDGQKLFFFRGDLFLSGLLFLVSLLLRLGRISMPSHAVLGEAASLKIVQSYFNRTFENPKIIPGGHLLVFGCLKLLGYFTDGLYEEPQMLVLIRIIFASFSSLLILVLYFTLRFLGCGLLSSTTTALFLMVDNGSILTARFGGETALLLFFFSLNLLFWSLSRIGQREFFSLLCSGVFCGVCCATHLFGVYTFLFFPLAISHEFWQGLPKITISQLTLRCTKLATTLLIIPVCVFSFLFYIHFAVLSRAGTGVPLVSKEFQRSLEGNGFTETFQEVLYGSKILLRHEADEPLYLHSHPETYPEGSKQQQVTLYGQDNDPNNFFVIRKPLLSAVPEKENPANEQTVFEPILCGSTVRLEHINTQRFLHTHHINALQTIPKENREVSCYGVRQQFSDENDNWILEMADSEGRKIPGSTGKPIQARKMFLRFHHPIQKCELCSLHKNLPSWAFNQMEVTCGQRTRNKFKRWTIEATHHPLQDKNSPKTNYTPKTMLNKLFEVLPKIYDTGNEGLTENHSRPSSWPRGVAKILLWSSEDKITSNKLVLEGNQVVWAMCLMAVLLTGLLSLSRLVLRHFGAETHWLEHNKMASPLFLWYLIVYLPHFKHNRLQTLLDYMPAFYLSLLLFGLLLEKAVLLLKRPRLHLVLCGLLSALAIHGFLRKVSLTYFVPPVF